MKFSDKANELYHEYMSLAHAVQSGVAAQMEKQPDAAATSPKHLRTGVNMAMVEHSALLELLIAKGIITDEEYLTSLVQKTREEKEKYERILSDAYGAKVDLA